LLRAEDDRVARIEQDLIVVMHWLGGK